MKKLATLAMVPEVTGKEHSTVVQNFTYMKKKCKNIKMKTIITLKIKLIPPKNTIKE